MTSKRRVDPPRSRDKSRQFEKDWERLSASGRYDLQRLKRAMLLLVAGDAPLPPELLDHPLTGEWDDHRECHIGGDWLLIYRLERRGKHELVTFARTGTHAELFR